MISDGGVAGGTGGSLVKVGTGTLALTGANTYTGGTTISGGTLQLGNNTAGGSILGNILDNGVLVFARTDTYQFDGVISGAGALQQNGSGKTILTAASTYTGPTTVNAGTLIVNGSLASGVTVNGGLFGGSGKVASLTLNGGALSPGNSIGTITITGNLVMASAAAYLVEVSTTSADMTKVGGTAKLAGTLAFFPVSGVYTVGTQ